MQEFRAEIAINGSLMFSCGSPVRPCWAELEYDRILAVGGRGLSYVFPKFRKTIYPVFSAWQVDRYDGGVFYELWDDNAEKVSWCDNSDENLVVSYH